VASVRPSDPDASYRLAFPPNGRLDARATTVERLILTSYNLHRSQVVDEPDWVNSARFDILATAPDGAPVDGLSTMARIRALLRDRFGLRTHTEMREAQVYELDFARADHRLGPGLRPSTIDCEAAEKALQDARARGERPTIILCRASFSGGSDGVTVFRYGGRTMDQIAMALSNYAGRMVVDRTGLAGRFDMEVTFTTDVEPGSNAVSIFTAAQEQLGLKLEDRRTGIQVRVIDEVEPPEPN